MEFLCLETKYGRVCVEENLNARIPQEMRNAHKLDTHVKLCYTSNTSGQSSVTSLFHYLKNNS